MGTWLTVVCVLAFIGSLFFVLIALITAIKDPVPIRSIAARLLYMGRHGHLRALQRLAAQRAGRFRNPMAGTTHSAVVKGAIARGRWVEIISGVRFTTTGTDTAYYFLNVSLSTRKTLLGHSPWLPGPEIERQNEEIRL